MMTEKELRGTIDYLKNVVFKLEERPDADNLKENTDRLKDEIRLLEDRLDALQSRSNESAQ
jgi:cell division protein FtsB